MSNAVTFVQSISLLDAQNDVPRRLLYRLSAIRQPALNDLLNVIVRDLCRLGLTPAQLSPGDPSNRLAESSDLQANVALQYAERQQSSMAKRPKISCSHHEHFDTLVGLIPCVPN